VHSGKKKLPVSLRTLHYQNKLSKKGRRIGSDISDKLKSVITDSSYFSLALDESTDTTDTAQLLIFIRTVSKAFVINEELLALEPLQTQPKDKTFMTQL
jgi:hypothetical protein